MQKTRSGPTQVWRWLAALLLLVSSSWVAAPAAAEEPARLDDALLLMLATQNRMYAADGQTSLPASGASRPTLGEINEHRQLAKLYDDWSWDLEKAPISSHLTARAAEHEAKAQALDQARQRAYARGKGLQLFLRRRVLRPVGQAVGWTARGVIRGGKVILVFAREELAARAKQIVRAKLADVRNLLQGRIDAVWHRIALKIGMPLTELIRQVVVDPAFVRLRDQLAARTGVGEAIAGLEGREQDDPEAEATPDDEPTPYDDIPYDEEGDTDYDEAEPAGEPGVYDIRSWFSEETIASDCAALMGEHAHDAANYLHFYKNSVDGGDGIVIRLQCDYRTQPELLGASLDLEVFDQAEFVVQARGADWWEHYCGSDAVAYHQDQGELICEADGQYIEKRNCTISDCVGCPPSQCTTNLIFTDGNAWASIMLETLATDEGDRVAAVREIAERVRQVLAAKRQAERP